MNNIEENFVAENRSYSEEKALTKKSYVIGSLASLKLENVIYDFTYGEKEARI